MKTSEKKTQVVVRRHREDFILLCKTDFTTPVTNIEKAVVSNSIKVRDAPHIKGNMLFETGTSSKGIYNRSL